MTLSTACLPYLLVMPSGEPLGGTHISIIFFCFDTLALLNGKVERIHALRRGVHIVERVSSAFTRDRLRCPRPRKSLHASRLYRAYRTSLRPQTHAPAGLPSWTCCRTTACLESRIYHRSSDCFLSPVQCRKAPQNLHFRYQKDILRVLQVEHYSSVMSRYIAQPSVLTDMARICPLLYQHQDSADRHPCQIRKTIYPPKTLGVSVQNGPSPKTAL